MVWLGEDRPGRPAGEQTGLELAMALGSAEEPESLEEMRATSATGILVTLVETPGSHAGAIIDGWVFPDDIQTIFEQGRQNQVPVIIGSNADEGTMFAPAEAPTTVDEFRRFAQGRYGDLAGEFLDAYPVGDDEDVREIFVNSVGDAWFTWQMRTWARLTATGDTNAWLYYFTRVPPISQSDEFGSNHGAEIVYVIGNFHLVSFVPEPEDQKLARTMSDYWVNFAATGDPNGEGLADWPAYDMETEAFMELGDTIRQGTRLLEKQSDFFERYNAAERANR
jgi:para-nitrobenzyl esterase